TAVVRFKGVRVSPDDEGNAAFELRSGIEHSGDENADSDRPTQVSVRVRNRASQNISDEIIVEPESNRTIFFKVPAAQLAGGDFDLLIKCLTGGDHLGLQQRSL